MDNLWLPEGHHWGLRIEHRRLPDAGEFTGGGHKLIWHTTEGGGIDAMWRVLRDKNAAPHFVIDPGGGDAPVYQCIPLNMAARALEHPAGTPETNRANAIQVEIVGYAKDAPKWGHVIYRDLGALAALIDHRFNVRRGYRPFTVPARKVTPAGFVRATGHLGHGHVPNNSHWDPGRMNGAALMRAIADAERRYA
jgi:hypothetical protein